MSQVWRASSLLLGLLLIWIAVAFLPRLSVEHPLTVHMTQHLLLMSLAPPLMWLALPIRLGRRLGHPVVCWMAATVALVAWHVPSLFMLSMHSKPWHTIELSSFFGAGMLFWWPVIQTWPASSTESRWPIVLYLFLATLPCDILSGLLVFSERVVYPMSSSAHQHSALSALDDQQLAGALMWTVVTVVYLVAGVIVSTRELSGGLRTALAPR